LCLNLNFRPKFSEIVKNYLPKGLLESSVGRFVGLGAVRYCPKLLEPNPETAKVLSDALQREIDRYNDMIAQNLAKTDDGYIFKVLVPIRDLI
jgi:hypothetical protein